MSTLEAGETSTAQLRKAFVVKALVKFLYKGKENGNTTIDYRQKYS